MIVTYLGAGDGTFQPYLISGGPAPGLRAIATADFNGDGNMDVAAISDCNPTDCTYGTLTIMLGNGDGTFTAGASYSVNGAVIGANTMATGDLNGDGHQDIVIGLGCDFSVSGCSTGAVLVFLGNGDGTFETPVDYPTVGNQILPIVTGDFNRDGKQDVLISVSAGLNPGSLILFPGNGDGTLGTPVISSLGVAAGGGAIAAADFNSDGNPDAVTIGINGVAVAFGNADGTFQTATAYGLNNNATNFPQSIAIADMNGDGKPDIVVGEGQGGSLNAAAVLINDGTGNFPSNTVYSMTGSGPVSVAAADFNGDGKNDVLLASEQNSSDGAINLLVGNGDGTFRSAQYLSTAGIGAGTGSVAAADFNGDGFQDLVIPVCPPGTTCPSGFALFLSDGAGGYQAPQSFASTTLAGEFLAVGDFNKDGKPDVVVVSNCADGTCSQDAASIFVNTGNGTFAESFVYGLGGITPLGVVTGDFNGDGKLDIAVLNQCATPLTCGTEASVIVLLGNGDGTFQPVITTPISPTGSVFWVAAADLNRDGLTDLVVTENGSDASDFGAESAQILISNGDGTFTLGGNYLTGGDVNSSVGSTVAIGDVNGDGNPDIVTANHCDLTTNGVVAVDAGCGNGAIGILLGNGDGTFHAAKVTNVPDTGFDGISLADVNQDGKLDIVASIGPGIVVFLGNGDGTFQNPTIYSGGATGGNNQMAIADLRNDGGLDIVQSGEFNQLTIFYDEGFTLPSTTTTVQSSQNPSVYAENVTFTATVTSTSGTPTGTVTLTLDGTPIASASLSGGSASFTEALAAGTHSIAASYGGDGDHAPGNSAAISQVVNPGTTTTVLTSTANPSYVSQTVTYTATMKTQSGNGNIQGSVTFKDGSTVLGTFFVGKSLIPGQGSALVSETYSAKGTHSITATYSGDANNLASASNTLKQTVNALPAATKTSVTTSGSPSTINQPVTFTAAVSSTFGPIPDGENVTFSNGTTVLATVPFSSGTASFTTSTLKAGTFTIKAAYAGDANFKASSGTVKQTVALYTSSVSTPTSSLNPSIFGQAVSLSVTVTSAAPSTPTGSVTFKNGTTSLGTITLDPSGAATLTKSNLPAGSLSITAAYNGNSQISKSTSPVLIQVVNQAAVSMTLAASPNPSTAGQSVKFTASFTSKGALPTGSVTFTAGATTLGTGTITGGKATLSTTALPQGADTVTATFAGNADFSAASAQVVQQVN
ncbi:MAG TPA: FG-GAP-like repeat-containing protein [Candidatus Acidoferrales bacterium]|nr:FG-GAP-like repeat-containing protein [Candidatus Acidoferrales bacterium]